MRVATRGSSYTDRLMHPRNICIHDDQAIGQIHHAFILHGGPRRAMMLPYLQRKIKDRVKEVLTVTSSDRCLELFEIILA